MSTPAPPPAAAAAEDAFPLHALDESGVAALLASLGFPFYEDQLKDHGITGPILIHLDHEALRDVGIHSVGQRLAILRAVYALKVQQNIPVEVGQWVPPSEDMEDATALGAGVASPDGMVQHPQILDLLGERDDRIRILESEVQKLHDTLLTIREDVMRPQSKPPRPSVRSPTSSLFPNPSTSSTQPHPLSNQSTLSRVNSMNKPAPLLSTSTLTAAAGNSMPDSPRSPMDSPRMPSASASESEGGAAGAGMGLTPGHEYSAPLVGQPPRTPTTPTAPVAPVAGSGSGLAVPSTTTAHPRHRDVSTSSSTSTSTSAGDKSAAVAADTNNPYRSFRVTLEDPCYKVLPAALKKYKINDDWRQYALFICYGNTERCLAYDEKPLLLFQRLKESANNPVFMLRHIKDIKSPIAVAAAKHAARRTTGGARGAGVGGGVERALTVNRDGVQVAQGAGARPTRLHHPPVLLPVGKDKEEGGGGGGGHGPPPSPREAPGYCISIYPYLAEREDEFDVTVGDTFVIISKTKGWWVVHRDLGPTSSSEPRKSAWVPAGCLLETSVPPLSLAPPSLDLSGLPPGNAATVPIEPQWVVSVSTPNVALMDYERGGEGEVEVRKGTGLRILKRYNHWSYAIKEDGQRGWIPSWFCGRAARNGDGAAATPTTPTTAEGRAALSSSAGRERETGTGTGRERSTSSAAAVVGRSAPNAEEGEAGAQGGTAGAEEA